MNGRLIILSGPSGVGKDTVLAAWSARNPRVSRVVAYTTRKPRAGETDGVDYHFVSEAKFHELRDQGWFLESKFVHGNYYATPLHDMEELLNLGHLVILKIDVQGALEAVALRPDAASVFLLAPSWEELERRIRGRATDSPEVIEKRLANARSELAQAHRYTYQVVNHTVDGTVDQLEAIFASPQAAT